MTRKWAEGLDNSNYLLPLSPAATWAGKLQKQFSTEQGSLPARGRLQAQGVAGDGPPKKPKRDPPPPPPHRATSLSLIVCGSWLPTRGDGDRERPSDACVEVWAGTPLSAFSRAFEVVEGGQDPIEGAFE